MGNEYEIDREYAAEVGKRLVELRNELSLTQEELCEQTGLDRGLLSQWESGIRTPNVPAWIALSSFYGVSTDYIAGNSTQRVFKSSSTSDKIDFNRLNPLGQHLLFEFYHILEDCSYTNTIDD